MTDFAKVLLSICFLVLLVAVGMWVFPLYGVWQQGLSGEAELARAKQNRQIRIEEAEARLEAARFESQAEVERARGVAEANDIIAGGLGGAEGYLRYLYIDMLRETGSVGRETIYIPTEAAMPIMEAGRLKERVQPAE